MHISQDLSVIKICNAREGWYTLGLACVVVEVSFHRRTTEVRLGTNTMVDGPSPKLDQHGPSHSRMHYT